MSVTEILQALPKLTAEQRSSVAQKLRELEEQDGMLFLHEAADAIFVETDKEEEGDAGRKPR